MTRRVPLFLLLPLGLLALWHVAVEARWVTEGLVPSPAQVVASWSTWVFGSPTATLSPYSGTWLANALYSSRRVLQGFALAALVGIPLGLLIGWNRLVARVVDPSIQMLRPVPITAWLPFSIASRRSRSRNTWLTGSTSLSAEKEARTVSWPRRRDQDQLRAGSVQDDAMYRSKI